MFNQVILAGRLAQEPETIDATDGRNKRTRICIAVQRPFKARGSMEYGTDFFYVTVWEGIAESAQLNCHKGSLILVKGRLEQNTYLDKNTNKKIHAINIIGERLVFIGGSLKADPMPELVSEESDEKEIESEE